MANQYTKKKDLITAQNRKEILWNLVNSLLAGGLVFLGSIADGNLSWQGVIASLITAGIVIVTKFKGYWEKEETEYKSRIFNFVH